MEIPKGEPVGEGTKKNVWWPDVSTLAGACSARMYGVWAALFSAVVTAIFATWSLVTAKPVIDFVDASAFIDVAIFAAIAFGIYKGSRFAAVAGLVVFLGEKIYQMAVSSTGSGIFLAVALTYCYVIAIRGTYALHRFRREQPAS
jgi:hypothetical protein